MTQPDFTHFQPEAERKLKKIIDKMTCLHPGLHWHLVSAKHKLIWDSEWSFDSLNKIQACIAEKGGEETEQEKKIGSGI